MAEGYRMTLREALDSGWRWAWTPSSFVAHALMDNGITLCGIQNASLDPPADWQFLACSTCSTRVDSEVGNRYRDEASR